MIILLGGNGYVGQAFARLFDERRIDYRVLSRTHTDYTNPRILEAVLADLRPDFLINSAGYTGKPNVDACEDDKTACLEGNSVLPGTINLVCGNLGIPWGHISSGCIFSGRRHDGNGFTESDPPNFCFRTNNCSFYSGTKALGEEILGYQETLDATNGRTWCHRDKPQAYVWRLRIPFDHRDNPRNYLSKLMRYRKLLDAENSISHLDDFVQACFACYEKSLPMGIYNITNPGTVTTKWVSGLIAEQASKSKDHSVSFPANFEFFADEAEFMQQAARTPRSNCVLDGSKLMHHGIQVRSVEAAIRDSLERWSVT